MAQDLQSAIVVHAAMMATFAALFTLIRLVDRDWRFPWQIGAGFLFAPSVMVLIALGELRGPSWLSAAGALSAYVGPALMLIGAARLADHRISLLQLILGYAAYGVGHVAVAAAEFGKFGHLAVMNAAVIGFALAFIMIGRRMPREDHPLGRPLLIGLASVAIVIHAIRITAVVLGIGFDDRLVVQASATMILGTTIVAVILGVGAVVIVAERFAAQIRREARTDALTGLAVRRVFDQQLAAELDRWARYGRPFSVVLFDIDHFKRVNDGHGHDVGDEALKLVALCGRSAVRPSDLLARLGGDEFAILLPETRPEEAAQVATRILETLRATPLAARGGAINLTGSFGVSGVLRRDDTAEAVLKRADEAAYVVKRRGRDGVAIWDPATAQPGPRAAARA